MDPQRDEREGPVFDVIRRGLDVADGMPSARSDILRRIGERLPQDFAALRDLLVVRRLAAVAAAVLFGLCTIGWASGRLFGADPRTGSQGEVASDEVAAPAVIELLEGDVWSSESRILAEMMGGEYAAEGGE